MDAGAPIEVKNESGAIPRALPAIMYHLTTRANFRLNPKMRAQNNSTLGGDWEPGIFLGESVEYWVNGYGYWRPWVVDPAQSGAPRTLSSGRPERC